MSVVPMVVLALTQLLGSSSVQERKDKINNLFSTLNSKERINTEETRSGHVTATNSNFDEVTQAVITGSSDPFACFKERAPKVGLGQLGCHIKLEKETTELPQSVVD